MRVNVCVCVCVCVHVCVRACVCTLHCYVRVQYVAKIVLLLVDSLKVNHVAVYIGNFACHKNGSLQFIASKHN